MIKQVLLVGLGGAAGSMLRFGISLLTLRYYTGGFPAATFFVNLTGCFLIGILVSLLPPATGSPLLRALLIVGFCGGFTTFSAFSFENLMLIQQQQFVMAAIYILISVLAGMAAVWAGLKIIG